MATSVATPLEYQFAEIPGLSQMTSTNILGNTQITLQFDLDRNIDAAAQDVQSAINAAGGQLPKNLPSPPFYRKVNPADSPILILAVHSEVLPLTEVDDYAENVIAQQMSQIAGVGAGGHRRPAEARGAGAGRSGQDRLAGHSARRHRQRDHGGHGRCPEGIDQRHAAQLRHLRQRSARKGRTLERHRHRLQERCAGPHPRHRRGGGCGRRTTSSPAGRTASSVSCC